MAINGEIKWTHMTNGLWELQQFIDGSWRKLGEFAPAQKLAVDRLVLSFFKGGSFKFIRNNSEAEYIIPRRV